MNKSTQSVFATVLFSFITACGGGGDDRLEEKPITLQPSAVVKTDISKAKDLIKNSRTLVKQIGDNFDSPIDALDADQQTIESVYKSNVVDVADLLGQIVVQTITYFEITTTLKEQLDNPGTHTIPLVNDIGTNIGTLTAVVSTDDGLAITLNGSATGATGVTANVTNLKMTSSLNKSDIQLTKPRLNQPGWTGAFTSDDVRLSISGFIGNERASLDLEDVSLRITASEPVTVGFEGKQIILPYLTSASFSGTVVIQANDTTFTGKTEIKLVGLEEAKRTVPDTSLSIKYLALSGEFESPKGAFSTSVSLDIENAATFDTFGFMDHRQHERGSVLYTRFAETPFFNEKIQNCIEALGEGYVYSDISYIRIYGNRTSMQINCSIGYGPWATLTEINVPAEVVNDMTDYLRTGHNLTEKNILDLSSLNFNFREYPSSNARYGNLYYEIDSGEFENVDNFAKGLLTVTASATVPEIPSLVAILTVKREELYGGKASLKVSYGDETYTISLNSKNISPDSGDVAFTITLSNPDGVEVIFTSDGNEYGGTISVDGNNIGTVETAQDLPIVRYNDGTIETLF